MATVVNNDGTQGNGMGNLLAVVLVIAFVIALLYFGLPLLRGGASGGTGTQMNLPSEVNVNTK